MRHSKIIIRFTQLAVCYFVARFIHSQFSSIIPSYASTSSEKFSESQAPIIDDKFTILIATYQRPAMLRFLITDLIQTSIKIPSLYSILVIWQATDTSVPSWLTALNAKSCASTSTIPCVQVRRSAKNSMNERFLPDRERIRTRHVFMLDDDIALIPSDIEWGFQTYLRLQKGGVASLVGLSPRSHYTEANGSISFVIQPHGKYSMILSNAAFFETAWLEEYTHARWYEERNLVDEVMNCDDLLLNVVIASKTAKAPVLIRGRETLKTYAPLDGINTGLWTRPEHVSARSTCLDSFLQGGYLYYNDITIVREAKDTAEMVDSSIFEGEDGEDVIEQIFEDDDPDDLTVFEQDPHFEELDEKEKHDHKAGIAHEHVDMK